MELNLEPFKAKKGMDFESLYYHFFFLFAHEQYRDCLKQVKSNEWWYEKMNPEAKKQIYSVVRDIKGGKYENI